MMLILAPSASSWSEKPNSTLALLFCLSHRVGLLFLCGDVIFAAARVVRVPSGRACPNELFHHLPKGSRHCRHPAVQKKQNRVDMLSQRTKRSDPRSFGGAR